MNRFIRVYIIKKTFWDPSVDRDPQFEKRWLESNAYYMTDSVRFKIKILYGLQ